MQKIINKYIDDIGIKSTLINHKTYFRICIDNKYARRILPIYPQYQKWHYHHPYYHIISYPLILKVFSIILNIIQIESQPIFLVILLCKVYKHMHMKMKKIIHNIYVGLFRACMIWGSLCKHFTANILTGIIFF